jgi:hypothetical protein
VLEGRGTVNVARAITMVESTGATFRLQAERVLVRYPDEECSAELSKQIAFLRVHRDEVASLLRARAERIDKRAGGAEWQGERNYNGNAHLLLSFALDAINADYPHEMADAEMWPLKWCQMAAPNHYHRIAVWIPDQISDMIESRARLGELKRTLDEWVDLHREMYAMFRESGG